uniref:Ribonuclease P protein subunit p29 n=1 Tax=Homalodisca liturata TaxID=320908 RepID=A0A1B6IDK7_9HEMI
MASNFVKDNKGDRLTDQLPHYIKEESIGFRKKSKEGSDIITDIMEKYCAPERHTDLRKSLHKSMILGKHKVKPDLNIVPRAKKSHLSLHEKRILGLYKLPRKGLKYQEFLELHNLWRQYILDSLDLPQVPNKKGEVEMENSQRETICRQLCKMDYHGAMLTVVRSKCPSHIGVQGIVVMDTKNTFKLLGQDNIVRTIPKDTSVFQIQVDRFQLTMFGKYLCGKPAERTTKKFRKHLVPDL